MTNTEPQTITQRTIIDNELIPSLQQLGAGERGHVLSEIRARLGATVLDDEFLHERWAKNIRSRIAEVAICVLQEQSTPKRHEHLVWYFRYSFAKD